MPTDLLAPSGGGAAAADGSQPQDLLAAPPAPRNLLGPTYRDRALAKINATPGLDKQAQLAIVEQEQAKDMPLASPGYVRQVNQNLSTGQRALEMFTAGTQAAVRTGAAPVVGLLSGMQRAGLPGTQSRDGRTVGQEFEQYATDSVSPLDDTFGNKLAAGVGGALPMAATGLAGGGTGTLAAVGGAQSAGEAAMRDESLSDVAGAGIVGAAKGAAIGKVLGVSGQMAQRVANPVGRFATAVGADVAGNVGLGVGEYAAQQSWNDQPITGRGVADAAVGGLGAGLVFAPMTAAHANHAYNAKANADALTRALAPGEQFVITRAAPTADHLTARNAAINTTGQEPVWYRSDSPRLGTVDPQTGRMYLNADFPREAMEEAYHAIDLLQRNQVAGAQLRAATLGESPDLTAGFAENYAMRADAAGEPTIADRVRAGIGKPGTAPAGAAAREGVANQGVASMGDADVAHMNATTPGRVRRLVEAVGEHVVDRLTGSDRTSRKRNERLVDQFVRPVRENRGLAEQRLHEERQGLEQDRVEDAGQRAVDELPEDRARRDADFARRANQKRDQQADAAAYEDHLRRQAENRRQREQNVADDQLDADNREKGRLAEDALDRQEHLDEIEAEERAIDGIDERQRAREDHNRHQRIDADVEREQRMDVRADDLPRDRGPAPELAARDGDEPQKQLGQEYRQEDYRAKKAAEEAWPQTVRDMTDAERRAELKRRGMKYGSREADVAALTRAGFEDRAPRQGEQYYSLVGKRSIKNLPEEEREPALDKLRLAARLEKRGDADPEKIRLATGWFRSPYDGKWRHEVDDSRAQFKLPAKEDRSQFPPVDVRDLIARHADADPNGMVRLGDILDHPTLFKHYPDMADIEVQAQRPEGAAYFAGSTHGNEQITVHHAARLGSPVAKKSLMHEVQHAIQEREGFARGGNPGHIFANRLPGAEYGQEFKQRRERSLARMGPDMRRLTEDGQPLAEQLDASLAHGIYRDHAGEYEARNTADRIGLSENGRRMSPPLQTEGGLRPEDAIVRGVGIEHPDDDVNPEAAGFSVRKRKAEEPTEGEFKAGRRTDGGLLTTSTYLGYGHDEPDSHLWGMTKKGIRIVDPAKQPPGTQYGAYGATHDDYPDVWGGSPSRALSAWGRVDHQRKAITISMANDHSPTAERQAEALARQLEKQYPGYTALRSIPDNNLFSARRRTGLAAVGREADADAARDRDRLRRDERPVDVAADLIGRPEPLTNRDVPSYARAKAKPTKSVTVLDAARYLEQRMRDAGVTRVEHPTAERPTYPPKILAEQARNLADEAVYARSNPASADALGWYDRKIKGALSIMAEHFPEIARPGDDQTVFKAILAITSDGNKVNDNFRLAAQVYDRYKRTGQIAGKSHRSGIESNLAEIDRIVREHGARYLHDMLSERMTRLELLKRYGIPLDETNDHMVYGSMMLGPKIGSFYNNLNQRFDSITMDLWWSRTVGRLRGNLTSTTPRLVDKHVARMRQGLRADYARRFGHKVGEIRTDREAAIRHAVQLTAHNGSVFTSTAESKVRDGFKKGHGWTATEPQWRAAAKGTERKLDAKAQKYLASLRDWHAKGVDGAENVRSDGQLVQAAYEAMTKRRDVSTPNFMAAKSVVDNEFGTYDIPDNKYDRHQQRVVALEAIRQYRRRTGEDITPADFQALMWFHEKQIWAKLGVKGDRELADYESAARTVGDEIKAGKLRVGRLHADAGRREPPAAAGRVRQAPAAGDGAGPAPRAQAGGQAKGRRAREVNEEGANLFSVRARRLANDRTRQEADDYATARGLPGLVHGQYVEVQPDRAKRVADLYEAAKHEPGDPQVKAAYDAMKAETLDQYRYLQKRGVTIEPFGDRPQYENSEAMMRDVRDNRHLYFYQGGDLPADHPLAERVPGTDYTYNDVFRAVHDYFGHTKEGVGFGPRGEENAWLSHSQMYTPLARRAMTTETRGQNSWVNYGPHGEANRADPKNTRYADQKATLLPDWVSKPDAGTSSYSVRARNPQEESPEFKQWFGRSKMAAEGKPQVFYHATARDFTKFKPGGFDKKISGPAMWFSPSRESQPAGHNVGANDREGSRVLPVYLKIENPLDLTEGDPMTRILREKYNSAFPMIVTARDVRKLRDAGYDGVRMYGPKGQLDEVVALDPTQVKSATGNRGTFDPADADITHSVRRRPPTVGNSFALSNENVLDTLRRKVQDDFLPVRQLQRDLERQGGRVTDASRPYLKQELFKSRVGDQIERMEQELLHPIIDDMHSAGLSVDDVDQYLMARHAQERNAHVAGINPAMPDGGSGLTNAEARKILADVAAGGKQAQYDAVAAKVDDMNRRTLDLMVGSGLVSAADAAAMRAKYKSYVPLRTDMEEDGVPAAPTGAGYTAKSSGSKRATGRGVGNVADSPLTFSWLQAQEKIVRAEKNRVARSMLDLVRNNPDDALWAVNQIPTKATVSPTTGMVRHGIDPLFAERDNVVPVMENGQRHLIEFKGEAGKRIAAAMKRLNYADGGRLVQALGKAMRVYASLQTNLNPDFLIPNMLRDVQAAFVNLSADQSRAMAGRMVRGIPAAWKAVYDVHANRAAGAGREYHDYMREYRQAGGQIDTYAIGDFKRVGAEIQRMLDDKSPSRARRVVLAAKKGGDFLDRLNAATENAVRLSAYVEARKSGQSPERAASLAKNLTVNFSRKGELGTAVNSLYLFANASVQGNARFAASLMRTKEGRKIAAGIALAGLAYGLTVPDSFEERDGKSVYDQIPDATKTTNLVLPTGGDGYAKLPLPHGYNTLFTAGRLLGEATNGRVGAGAGAAQLLGAAANAFNPIGSEGDILQSLSPTILDPVVQAVTNKDWRGAPIVPEQSPFGPRKPQSSLARRDTTELAKGVASWLNSATGGDEVTPGGVDVSPALLDHFVGWATGGTGRFLGKAADAPNQLSGDEDVAGASALPVANRFLGRLPASQRAKDFYDVVTSTQDAKADQQHYLDTGQTQAAMEHQEAHRRELAWAAEAQRVKREGTKLRQAMDKAKAAGDDAAAARARQSLDRLLGDFLVAFRTKDAPASTGGALARR